MRKRLAAVRAASAAASTTAKLGRRRDTAGDGDLFAVLPTASRQPRQA
jgi:hypothetical protein